MDWTKLNDYTIHPDNKHLTIIFKVRINNYVYPLVFKVPNANILLPVDGNLVLQGQLIINNNTDDVVKAFARGVNLSSKSLSQYAMDKQLTPSGKKVDFSKHIKHNSCEVSTKFILRPINIYNNLDGWCRQRATIYRNNRYNINKLNQFKYSSLVAKSYSDKSVLCEYNMYLHREGPGILDLNFG